jgi:hypothetical protein
MKTSPTPTQGAGAEKDHSCPSRLATHHVDACDDAGHIPETKVNRHTHHGRVLLKTRSRCLAPKAQRIACTAHVLCSAERTQAGRPASQASKAAPDKFFYMPVSIVCTMSGPLARGSTPTGVQQECSRVFVREQNARHAAVHPTTQQWQLRGRSRLKRGGGERERRRATCTAFFSTICPLGATMESIGMPCTPSAPRDCSRAGESYCTASHCRIDNVSPGFQGTASHGSTVPPAHKRKKRPTSHRQRQT